MEIDEKIDKKIDRLEVRQITARQAHVRISAWHPMEVFPA